MWGNWGIIGGLWRLLGCSTGFFVSLGSGAGDKANNTTVNLENKTHVYELLIT